MAVIQVAAVVFAARAARRVGEVVNRFEQDVKPIVANLKVVSSDAARVSSAAAAQAQRAEDLLNDLAKRVGETAAAFQSGILGPAREGFAVIQALIAALTAMWGGRSGSKSGKQAASEEDDAMFIG